MKEAIETYLKTVNSAPATNLGPSTALDEVPALPREEASDEPPVHREKIALFGSPFNCCIAREVGNKEYSTNAKAKEAMDMEQTSQRQAA